MNRNKLNNLINEYLEVIKNEGVAALFMRYDPKDEEGNYLKRKILSQTHYLEYSYLDDEEFEKHIKAENQQLYFITKEEYVAMISLLEQDKAFIAQMFKNAAIDKVMAFKDKEAKECNQKLNEKVYAIEQMPLLKRLKNRKKKLSLERIIKENEEIFERIEIEREDRRDEINAFIAKHPTIVNCIDMLINIVEEFHLTSEPGMYVPGILTRGGEITHMLKFYIKAVQEHGPEKIEKVGIEWYNRANNIATAVLTAMKLPAKLTYDEFAQETRGKFVSKLDNVELSFRTHELDGYIGNFASDYRDIEYYMKKFKKIFDETAFDNMSEEEIITIAAQLSRKLVDIHPYSNGNGRTSRMIIDYILWSNGIESPVLFTGKESKSNYISVLNNSRNLKNDDFAKYIIQKREEQFGKELKDETILNA